MTTKYNLGDTIKTTDFIGVISMITITKNGTRYRAYGSRKYSDTLTVPHSQDDIWEEDILEDE